MQDSQLSAWLALSYMPGMNSVLFNQLLAHFESPQKLFASDQAMLVKAGLKSELRAAIQHYKTAKNSKVIRKVEESLHWHSKEKSQYILCKESSDYPALLRTIPDSPPLLYIKGNPKTLAWPQLAMVGSRNPGPVGRRNARDFAGELTRVGYAVCSGMALGIDYESHRGALDAGGITLAVLGAGIDQLYPKQNVALAEKITEQGALISEFPLGTKPHPWNFPQRNRIISGLSQGTLVVEAALRSGSLITARFALEQGREVFAIPGSINSATTKGCHSLIKQGAKLVEKLEDIVEELGAFVVSVSEQDAPAHKKQETPMTMADKMSETQALVLSKIDYDAVNINSLIVNTGLSASAISVILTKLEMKGIIQAVAGGYILSVF